MYRMRSATRADEQFVREMLLYAAFPPWAETPTLDEALQDERVARYVIDWGRPGDEGVIAEADDQPVGAAWYRLFSSSEPGFGFISENIPELSIAVAPGMRGRGIGRALLAKLIEQAEASLIPAISLSVSARNPAAMHLYQSLGFRAVAGDIDHPTMLRRVASRSA